MANDVLDHDDGVIHQDANRKDQCEKRHAVERVPEQVEDSESQCEGYGNGQKHDA